MTKATQKSMDNNARKALDMRAGDMVRVWQKIEEKGKTRLQAFEGIVLARKHGNTVGATFTVRKMIDGVGVERIYPLYTPMIDRIELLRHVKTRRSKLYYIRDKAAKEIRKQMRNERKTFLVSAEDGNIANEGTLVDDKGAIAEKIPSSK